MTVATRSARTHATRYATNGALVVAALALASGAACNRKPKRVKLAWAIGVTKLDAVALGLARTRAPDALVDQIYPRRLVIPTYDGSGQATHPDILLERDAHGAPTLTMAMTPYPFSNAHFENPSLLVSHDGIAFAPLPGAPAPLVPPPAYDHNDDPDLRRDPRTGEYELLYLETLRPDKQVVVALRSRDLKTWTRRDAITYDLKAGAPFIVSPAAIEDRGKTYLFYVDANAHTLHRLVSDDGVTWDVKTAQQVPIALGDIKAWHVDVVRGETGFALLFSGYTDRFDNQDLYIATSPDLTTWTLRREPLLAWRDPTLGVETLYRSTGLVDHGALIVWYAMQYRP